MTDLELFKAFIKRMIPILNTGNKVLQIVDHTDQVWITLKDNAHPYADGVRFEFNKLGEYTGHYIL